MKVMTRYMAILLLLLAFPFPISARTSELMSVPLYGGLQSSTASLSGTIVDEHGAAIAGAVVLIENIATQIGREARSNDSGFYVFPSLPPGTYNVTVRRDGFAPVEIKNVLLEVNDQRALEVRLKVGNVSDMVTITGESGIQESAVVATVVDRQFVENLPMNGRTFQPLIMLSPGTVLTKASAAEEGQFSVNGQRADANYFTVDGVSANASISGGNPGQATAGSLPGLSAGGGTNTLVSVDALQEFRIQTSSYAPEFGRTTGAQVQMITRSGTNQFHGTLFDYFRNDALDAKDWFANQAGLPKAAVRQNDFGGVLGGPIITDRTFFFVSYEGQRLLQPQVGLFDVPSIGARAAAPPQIKPYLSAFPIPNGPAGPFGFARFSASFSDPSTIDAGNVRIDQSIGGKWLIFGRYNEAPSSIAARGGISNSAASEVAETTAGMRSVTIGVDWVGSARLSNEIRVNYTRSSASLVGSADGFGGAVPLSSTSIFPSGFSLANSVLAYSLIGGLNADLQIGPFTDFLQRQINLVDNLSVIAGAHQVRVGVDYRHLSPRLSSEKYEQAALFNGVTGPVIPGVGDTAVSGHAFFSFINSIDGNTLFFNNISVYGQDTWKATPRVTLTYGLRWDVNPAPHGEKPLVTVNGLENPATATLGRLGARMFNTDYKGVAPRIGAVYQLFRRRGFETLLRGGFGVFYDLGAGSLGLAYGSFPYGRLKFLPRGADFPFSSSDAAPRPFGFTPPLSQIFVADPNLELPRVYQWNVAIEQSLGSGQTISASYIGAVGRELLRSDRVVNPNPTFSTLLIARNTATSDYHAFQVQFRRRLSAGLQVLASYTWAKSLDSASNDSSLTNIPAVAIDPRLDRGPSDFDVRHTFNSAVVYDIPGPKEQTGALSALRDWSVDTIFGARSATPVNVTYGAFLPGVGSFALRPDVVPGVPLYISDPAAPGGRRINNTVTYVPGNPNPQIGPFIMPVNPRQGTLGRNALRGFSFWQLDLGLRRRFKLHERLSLQLGAEIFNILNHPNFADPIGDLTDDQFGFSTMMFGRGLGSGGVSGGLNPIYQVGASRSVQLAAKVQF
jgi:hypothetical protein